MLTEVDPVQTEKAQGPDITERGHFRECLGSTMVLDPELHAPYGQKSAPQDAKAHDSCLKIPDGMSGRTFVGYIPVTWSAIYSHSHY